MTVQICQGKKEMGYDNKDTDDVPTVWHVLHLFGRIFSKKSTHKFNNFPCYCILSILSPISACRSSIMGQLVGSHFGTKPFSVCGQEQLCSGWTFRNNSILSDHIPLEICETIPDVSCSADVLWPSPGVCAPRVKTQQACAENGATSAPVTWDLIGEWERWRGEWGKGRLVVRYPGNGHKHCQSKTEHEANQSTRLYKNSLTKSSYCGS